MSGLKVMRGQRLVGKIASAAAVALLGNSAFADAPKPEALNTPSGTHWFSDWEVNTNPAPLNFYATPFANNGNVAAVQATLNAAALNEPLGIKIQAPGLSTAAAHALYN